MDTKSNRVLMKFCKRLHGDRTNPIGPIFTIDQIGDRELQIAAAGRSTTLKASNSEIIESLERPFFVKTRELSDEFYQTLCKQIKVELGVPNA